MNNKHARLPKFSLVAGASFLLHNRDLQPNQMQQLSRLLEGHARIIAVVLGGVNNDDRNGQGPVTEPLAKGQRGSLAKHAIVLLQHLLIVLRRHQLLLGVSGALFDASLAYSNDLACLRLLHGPRATIHNQTRGHTLVECAPFDVEFQVALQTALVFVSLSMWKRLNTHAHTHGARETLPLSNGRRRIARA